MNVLSVTPSETGELLFLVAKEPSGYPDMPYFGLLIVARRRNDGCYAAVVWHGLYPWAIKYLGLETDASLDQRSTPKASGPGRL